VPTMSRLRLWRDTSEPSRPRGYTAKMFLIVGSALGAAVLTATHPEISLPLNVALAVLGNLYVVTRDSRQAAAKGDDPPPDDRSR